MPSNLWYEPGEYLQMKCYLITPPTLQPAETSGEKCYVRPFEKPFKNCAKNMQISISSYEIGLELKNPR